MGNGLNGLNFWISHLVFLHNSVLEYNRFCFDDDVWDLPSLFPLWARVCVSCYLWFSARPGFLINPVQCFYLVLVFSGSAKQVKENPLNPLSQLQDFCQQNTIRELLQDPEVVYDTEAKQRWRVQMKPVSWNHVTASLSELLKKAGEILDVFCITIGDSEDSYVQEIDWHHRLEYGAAKNAKDISSLAAFWHDFDNIHLLKSITCRMIRGVSLCRSSTLHVFIDAIHKTWILVHPI